LPEAPFWKLHVSINGRVLVSEMERIIDFTIEQEGYLAVSCGVFDYERSFLDIRF